MVRFQILIINKLRTILRTLPGQLQALNYSCQRPPGTSALVGVPPFLSARQRLLSVSELVVYSAYMRPKGCRYLRPAQRFLGGTGSGKER